MLHEPIMVPQVLAALVTDPAGLYVDATVGTAGHSLALADRLRPGARLLALDWDPRALAVAKQRLEAFGDVVLFRRASFGELPEILATVAESEGRRASGVLIDPGLSSFALDDPSRGLSHRFPASPLDMRYDPDSGETAAQRLRRAPERDIEKMLRVYGEVRPARRLARGIAAWRRERSLETVGDLVSAIEASLGRKPSPRLLSQCFQALRIELHRDLDALGTCLEGLHPHVEPGGRLVVLCYHSLETRTVREVVRRLKDERDRPVWVPHIRKAQTPTREELDRNPRARSARLRVYRKGSRT